MTSNDMARLMARTFYQCPFRELMASGTALGRGWADEQRQPGGRCHKCMFIYATQTPKREKLHLCWEKFIEGTKEV